MMEPRYWAAWGARGGALSGEKANPKLRKWMAGQELPEIWPT